MLNWGPLCTTHLQDSNSVPRQRCRDSVRGALRAMFAPESGDSSEDGAENCADLWPLNHFLFLKVAGAISCQRGRLQLYYVYGSIISDSRLSGLSTSLSSAYGSPGHAR